MTKRNAVVPPVDEVPVTPELSLTDDLPHPPVRRRSASRMKELPYQSVQMDLFQSFVCNTDDERDRLSNTIDIWDSVPRYSISRQEMNKRRDDHGGLPVLCLHFDYRGQSYTADIQPALVKEGGKFVAYYPSANEELVEDALRKIAARQNQGFYEHDKARSGVAFSLYELREELASRGHTRSYQEIIRSLTILQKSIIDLRVGEGRGEAFIASSYLPALAAVSKTRLETDPGARWVAQFHPLVTQCIDQLTYRQFNYITMMSLPTQLSRWLHKQLSIKFTFAGFAAKPFEVRFSTIKRDSNLLNRGRDIDNRRDVDEAFSQLVNVGVLREIAKKAINGKKGKVVEVIYELFPSQEFIKEMKASNMRFSNNSKAAIGSNR